MNYLICICFAEKNNRYIIVEDHPKIIRNHTPFKFLILLCMIYCATLLLSGLYVYRPVSWGEYTFAASSLIYPLSYAFNDIICEVYGYENSRRLIWFGLIVIFFFAFITKGANHLPFPDTWKNQSSYMAVLDPYLRLSWAGLASMVVGEFVNIIMMSKWKILLKGKLFWLRSLGATSIGSAIDTLAEYIVAFAGLASTSEILEMFLFAYFFRICFAVFITVPSTITVSILKKVEHVDMFKPAITYNPFKLGD